jgi:hypothetical protein
MNGSKALSLFLLAGLAAPAQVPMLKALSYETGCSVGADSFVTGTITNRGGAPLEVSGLVSFEFYSDATTQTSGLTANASAIIQPGRTATAARARLPFQLFPGARCRFVVASAVKKLG